MHLGSSSPGSGLPDHRELPVGKEEGNATHMLTVVHIKLLFLSVYYFRLTSKPRN